MNSLLKEEQNAYHDGVYEDALDLERRNEEKEIEEWHQYLQGDYCIECEAPASEDCKYH